MDKIPFIDIADVNCWMIYLMPFDTEDRSVYKTVGRLQQKCIEERIFGMGWDISCFEYGTPMTDENAAKYVNVYNHQEKNQTWTVSEAAVNDYKSINKDDYVIMRLKNGHYYVGRVSSPGAMYIYKAGDEVYGNFSWGGTVERWVEYSSDGELPSEIVGRFSQRIHSTIQRIASYRQRLLVISMYESFEETEKRFDIPKLRIGANNFVRSLTYMELEDLVALYITNRHKEQGYKLLPSSCKVSQQNYEFRFVSHGKKPITCQVKNQQDIELNHYVNETGYEKIYIFSGKWDDAFVDELRAKYKAYEQIHIISPSELFEALKKDNIFENAFYDFEHEPVLADRLKLDGLNKCKKQPKCEKDYSVSEGGDFACFVRKDGLFYSAEFGALILSWHILDDHEYERKCIDSILSVLNDPQ